MPLPLLSQTVGRGSLTTQDPPEGSGNDPALKEPRRISPSILYSRAGLPENGKTQRSKSHLGLIPRGFRHPSKLLSESSEKKHRVDASPLVVHER